MNGNSRDDRSKNKPSENEPSETAFNEYDKFQKVSSNPSRSAVEGSATDVASLNLPNLYQHSTIEEQRQEQRGEMRNEYENNSSGTGGSVPSTVHPCFKQDASLHQLPTDTVSLKAPVTLSEEQLKSQQNAHHRRSSSNPLRCTMTAPFIAVAADNASIESGLTTDEAANAFSTIPAYQSRSSIEERAEQIIQEARQQSSISYIVSKRSEDIIQEARMAAAAARTTIGKVTHTSDALSIDPTGNDCRQGSSYSCSSAEMDPSRRREIIQAALNRASRSSKAAAAQAVSAGRAITQQQLMTHSPILEETSQSSPSPTSPASPPQSPVTPFQTTESPQRRTAQQESSSRQFFTQSTGEVLELAKILLQEAQAQVDEAPVAGASFQTASSLDDQDQENFFSTPPRRHVEAPRRKGRSAPISRTSSHDNYAADSTIASDGPPTEFQLLSPSESDIASLDDFERAVDKLPSRFTEDGDQCMSREKFLRKLDGMPTITGEAAYATTNPVETMTTVFEDEHKSDTVVYKDDLVPQSIDTSFAPVSSHHSVSSMKKAPVRPVRIKSLEVKRQPDDVNTIGSWFSYFLGTKSKDTDSDEKDPLEGFAVSCGSSQMMHLPAIGASLVRTANVDPVPRIYPEIPLSLQKDDAKLQQWVDNKFREREKLPGDGSYRLGESKSIVVHELVRGNWTWSTAWSPDGKRLAIATENHELAVVETTESVVWRVRHDRRAKGPPKKGTTHSIRTVAWGDHFIAIGGTGNAVSILAPTEPYPILHTITPTGFVGSMDWLPGTNKLLIASRLGKAILLDVWADDDELDSAQLTRDVQSTVLHMIDREKAWVNCVHFSPSRTHFALGDSKGILSAYSFKCPMEGSNEMEVINVANFKLEDSILDLEWSADGQYLYAGGEDFSITVIATQRWEPVHRIKRDRWVQFMSSSRGSSHLAVGGVNTEVSILEVNKGWDNVINIGLKGMVPLSGRWHPQDNFLVLTGQNNSVLAIETTNARHVSGHFLRSVYPICSVAFSPYGRMAAVGNEMGIVTIFRLSSKTFVSIYEMVVDTTGSLSMQWSQNGAYIAIATGNKVVIVARTETLPGSAPPSTSGFFVAKVVRDLGEVHDVSVDPTSRFVAASGTTTRILDATSGFKAVLEMENGGKTLANSWSTDGQWFAVIGVDHSLVIYDTSPMNLSRWKSVFTVKTHQPGLSLAWGPSSIDGLQYLAYGGEDKHISVMEIRTKERTWETVLDIRRDGDINSLDWNKDGLVAAAISNGTVTILDLSYLQSGWAVNEMDYNWQRQALTCFTEIRRNRGSHSMKAVRWIPSAPDSNSFLAFGGTDGELEILDLTENKKCKGFTKYS